MDGRILAIGNKIEDEIIRSVLEGSARRTTEDEVLQKYRDIIDKFDADQNRKWGNWKARLPERVALVTNIRGDYMNKAQTWKKWNYLFIILAAAIPIITGVLIAIESLNPFVALIDAVFPIIVGIVKKETDDINKIKEVLISVESPHYTLLNNIINDINNGTYTEEQNKMYNERWDTLEKTLSDAGIPLH